MRILFLEDEEAIRGFVRINLKRNGMDVTEAEDGETALELAKSAVPPFDIALLDVMLPTISGFEVCQQLRQLFPRMGIIMLTAMSQEEDKIRGLELGADDYVQKPFSPGELIARLNALKRRMMPYGEEQALAAGTTEAAKHGGEAGDKSAEYASVDGESAEGVSVERNFVEGGLDANASAVSGGTYAPDPSTLGNGAAAVNSGPLLRSPLVGDIISGPFLLSATERRLWKANTEIVLTPTEWTLVKLLMEREGEGLSRDDILNAVWGRHYVGDLKIVDVNIRRVRQKIEIVPSDPKHIETLWGFGYRWNRSGVQ